jgi:hypothetical protein
MDEWALQARGAVYGPGGGRVKMDRRRWPSTTDDVAGLLESSFTVGHSLEQRRVGSRVANAFVVLVVVIGVLAAIWVAITVDSGRSEV